MATLRSLYSDAVTANVPGDTLPPKPLVLGVINATQNSGVSDGRTVVTLNWSPPTENEEVTGEVVIQTATGTTQNFETQHDPISTYTLYDGNSNAIDNSDYAFNTTTGTGTLNDGIVTADDSVTMDYTSLLEDLDHFEFYRIKGNDPINPATYANVVASCTAVDTNVGSGVTTLDETLTAADNGETHTYYCFAVDNDSNTSQADKVVVDTIPSIPQNPVRTLPSLHGEVNLDWDDVTDDNFDGFNIYRCDGLTFTEASAVKANSVLLTNSDFEDGPDNTTNRVSSASLAYPVDGNAYSYKIESEDTDTVWTTGTNNQSSGVAASLIASLSA